MWAFKKEIFKTENIILSNCSFVVTAEETCPGCILGAEVTIGTQTWTKCNLNVSTYSDGIVIPEVKDYVDWKTRTTGAWCHYNNDPRNEAVYGKLYNWYAVAGIYNEASRLNAGLRKSIAPIGYHVPSDAEWTTLTNSLGGLTVAGGKMKETKVIGDCYWLFPNTVLTPNSGFAAIGAGNRTIDLVASFANMGEMALFWTSTENWWRVLHNDSTIVERKNIGSVNNLGLSVRLIKN